MQKEEKDCGCQKAKELDDRLREIMDKEATEVPKFKRPSVHK